MAYCLLPIADEVLAMLGDFLGQLGDALVERVHGLLVCAELLTQASLQ